MRLKLKLSEESANEVLKSVNDYKEHIVEAIRDLGTTLAIEGANIMRARILYYGAVESGELLSSVEGLYDATTGKGFVICASGHAAYVEYGTGIIGSNPEKGYLPYSLAEPKPEGWEHDKNNHGWDGWTYMRGRRWTRGQPPRPFVWETWLEMQELMKEKMMEIGNYGGS